MLIAWLYLISFKITFVDFSSNSIIPMNLPKAFYTGNSFSITLSSIQVYQLVSLLQYSNHLPVTITTLHISILFYSSTSSIPFHLFPAQPCIHISHITIPIFQLSLLLHCFSPLSIHPNYLWNSNFRSIFQISSKELLLTYVHPSIWRGQDCDRVKE